MPQLPSLSSRTHAPQKKPTWWEAHTLQKRVATAYSNLRNFEQSNNDAVQPKKEKACDLFLNSTFTETNENISTDYLFIYFSKNTRKNESKFVLGDLPDNRKWEHWGQASICQPLSVIHSQKNLTRHGWVVKPHWGKVNWKEPAEKLRIQSNLLNGASLVAQMVKNLPGMQEIWVWCLGWEDPLEKGMATRSSILAWRIPWSLAGYSSWCCKVLDTTERLLPLHP